MCPAGRFLCAIFVLPCCAQVISLYTYISLFLDLRPYHFYIHTCSPCSWVREPGKQTSFLWPKRFVFCDPIISFSFPFLSNSISSLCYLGIFIHGRKYILKKKHKHSIIRNYFRNSKKKFSYPLKQTTSDIQIQQLNTI